MCKGNKIWHAVGPIKPAVLACPVVLSSSVVVSTGVVVGLAVVASVVVASAVVASAVVDGASVVDSVGSSPTWHVLSWLRSKVKNAGGSAV